MPHRSRRVLPIAIAAALVLVPALAACSVAENVVGGVVGEARDQFDKGVSDALGGAGISTDGELPPGFPADSVPVIGEVQGGGSAPDAVGWVVNTQFDSADQFVEAQAALEAAGFTASAVNTDADSGFGTFTSAAFSVALTVGTGSDGIVTAVYTVSAAKSAG